MVASTQTLGDDHDAQVHVLGPVRLVDARGDEVAMSSVGQRRLVAALAVGGGVVRADWLGESLGLTPSALRTAISRLRGRATTDIVVTDGPGYRLAAGCDADQFAALVDGPGVGVVRLDALDEALGLWMGDALEEFAHEAWAEAEAARLDELRIVAGEERAALLIALGRSSAAVPDIEALATSNPMRDRVCGLLMQALAIDGRAVAALRRFQAHRTNLIEEAGVEPSVALQQIEQRIAQGASDEQRFVIDDLIAAQRWPIAPGDRNASRRLPANVDRKTNLSELHTRLLGRDVELRDAQRSLAQSRLVTITGPGGVGKTRLAREAGLLELDRTASGVWFADLSSATKASQIWAVVAEACQFPLAGPDPESQLVDFLAGLDGLVIVDNCEHLVDEVAAFLERVLARPGRCRVLATSRERLDIEGERLMRLSTLASEHGSDPAVELFVQRAMAANPSFDADDRLRSTIAELCRRLDGLPLAIELAAARSNVLSPQQLIDGLDLRFELLRGGRRRREVPVLQETLDWSYDLLDEAEQRVFRAMGCFAGSFPPDAVGPVAGSDRLAGLEIAESLVAKSLVVASPTRRGIRLALLESARAYALLQLEANDEVHEARARHLDHYRQECAPYLDTWAAKVGDTRLRPDADNLRAAAGWAAAQGRWEEAADVLRGSWHVLVSDPMDFDQRAVDCARRLDPDSERAAAVGMARLSVALENDDSSTMNEVLSSLLASPVAKVQRLLAATGPVMSARQDPDGALRSIAAQMQDAETANDDEVRAFLLYMAVAVHNGRGDAVRVVEASRAFDAFMREVGAGMPNLHAGSLAAEAVAHIALGDRPAALAIAERLDEISSGWTSSDELRILLHLDVGEVRQAELLLQPYCHEALSGRFTRQATAAVIYLAFLSYVEGDKPRAIELVQGIEGVSLIQALAALHLLCDRLGIDPPAQRASNEEMKNVREQQRRVLADELGRRGWTSE